MVNSPVVELAGFDLPNANIAVFTSRGYYRVVEGIPCGVEDGRRVAAGEGNKIGELVR